MRKQFTLLDTFQGFSDYWRRARSKPIDEQIRLWRTSYMNKYPELLDEQIQCYKAENVDWESIARQVFATLQERLPLMKTAMTNILATWEQTCSQASEKLGIDFGITLVIYVGIGCGAGWATSYEGKPAVLLGLENIAEEKWHTKTKLHGLIAHEIGHLAHISWRNDWESFEEQETDTLFHLYSEGFAQRCEQLIAGKPRWHMAPDKEWYSWCEQNKSWLANEFLKRINANMPVRDFFGSWFDIQGKKQTGYFLGYALRIGTREIIQSEGNSVFETRRHQKAGAGVPGLNQRRGQVASPSVRKSLRSFESLPKRGVPWYNLSSRQGSTYSPLVLD